MLSFNRNENNSRSDDDEVLDPNERKDHMDDARRISLDRRPRDQEGMKDEEKENHRQQRRRW